MKEHLQNRFDFVRIIPKENANFGLTLRKRLFCNAKPTLLPCKTAAFGMQNNRFCNALIASVLGESFCLNKSLHFYELSFDCKAALCIGFFCAFRCSNVGG
ncbi:hypothetical protein CTI16_10215 [Prevotella intermedia]|uniref:Uncharacterized protein n=1 Tax=Prevotella intermedia TaxID=28131 RepID=A0AAJ3RID3_PREIN|nr:hypothetical protein CUB95_10385 [Prevotella intermedia]PIK17364.1 hypothetical protein CTI16_10215 [Prevotella intermedia]